MNEGLKFFLCIVDISEFFFFYLQIFTRNVWFPVKLSLIFIQTWQIRRKKKQSCSFAVIISNFHYFNASIRNLPSLTPSPIPWGGELKARFLIPPTCIYLHPSLLSLQFIFPSIFYLVNNEICHSL